MPGTGATIPPGAGATIPPGAGAIIPPGADLAPVQDEGGAMLDYSLATGSSSTGSVHKKNSYDLKRNILINHQSIRYSFSVIDSKH